VTRLADVLVQLLASEDNSEISVINLALNAIFKLDAKGNVFFFSCMNHYALCLSYHSTEMGTEQIRSPATFLEKSRIRYEWCGVYRMYVKA